MSMEQMAPTATEGYGRLVNRTFGKNRLNWTGYPGQMESAV